MSGVLSFDIETIPTQKPLSEAQQEEFEKRMTAQIKKRFPEGYSLSQDEYSNLRGLVMATTPYLGEIVVIGLYGVDGEQRQEMALTGSEPEILNQFWNILRQWEGSFCSFNGLEFDTPFIVRRSMYHNIKPTNNRFLDLKRYSKWPHFDVKMVMGDYDKYASGKLSLVCDFLGVPSPKEGEVNGSQVEQAFLDGKINLIAEYCLRDVKATYECYNRIKDWTFNPQIKS